MMKLLYVLHRFALLLGKPASHFALGTASLVLISVFLISGCASKKEIIYKCEIPNALLEVPKFSTDRELNSQKDYAILLLDIYGAYEKCALNLKSIKRISDE